MRFRDLLGFVPFQRHNRSVETDRLSHLPLPAHRFFQPSGRSTIARNDVQVYSTPLALVGYGLQSLTPTTILDNLLADLLLRRYLPFMASFPDRAAFPVPAPQQLTCSLRRTPDFGPLAVLRRPAAIWGLDRP